MKEINKKKHKSNGNVSRHYFRIDFSLVISFGDTAPNSFMDSIMSPKVEHRKDKELGYVPWLVALWG